MTNASSPTVECKYHESKQEELWSRIELHASSNSTNNVATPTFAKLDENTDRTQFTAQELAEAGESLFTPTCQKVLCYIASTSILGAIGSLIAKFAFNSNPLYGGAAGFGICSTACFVIYRKYWKS